MKKNCRNNGITMIALCVTIIVLLILAGVTISTFEGKDGIFNQANDSKKSAAIVEEKEILNTTVAASVGASSKAQVEEAYIRKYLNENVGNENEKYILETDGDNFRIKFIDTGNEYVVSKDGNIYSNDEFNNELVLTPSEKLIVEVGEKETITANVTSVGSGVRWESEDETIAKIDYGDFSNDKEIKVIGVKNGTTKITAKISNGTQMTCEVTVQTSPKAITLNKRDVTLDLSIIKTEQLSVTYDPESSNVNRELTWTSSNPEVATVDENGLITGQSNGTTEIIATTKNGKKAEPCKVTIETSPIGISLNKDKDTLDLSGNKTIQLSVTYNPTSSNVKKNITWESSDTSRVTVDEKGLVTGKMNTEEGKPVKITAKTENGKVAFCYITVQTNPTSVTLNKTSETLDMSGTKTVQLTATINPGTANINKKITWSSNKTEVATVNSSTGLVTAKANGSVTITARTENGKTATCTIRVQTTPIGITLNKDKATIDLSATDKTTQLSVTYNPKTSDTKTKITWTSSNPNIASVSTSGLVTGKAIGSTVITAETENGKKETCTVAVIKNITSLTVSASKTTLETGNTMQVTANIQPTDTTEKITWSSKNTGVATVDPSTGVVTGKSNGTVEIVAKSSTTGKTASVTIKVQTSPQGISLNKTSETLDMSGTKTLQLSVTAYNPTTSNVNTGITWSSSNSNIASVSTSGLVTAKTNGKATITATTTNGKTASCSILVQTSPTSVTLNKTSETLDMSGTTTVQLTATINPGSANINTGKSWSSSNPGVATVNSSTGLVTAKANGTATITVRTGNGKTASCSITVHTNPTSVSISPTSVPLDTEGIQFPKTTKLTAKAKPDSADVNTGIKWSSDNPSVATVDSSGNVKAVGYGTANIKATAQNEKMAQCSVTVTTSISGLSVSPTSKTLNVGEKLDLSNSVTKTPSTAREGITWTSSNSSIASVSQTGVITANSAGTATITVKSSSGNRSATCTITVIKKYSSSEINSSFYGALVTNYHGPNDDNMKYRIFYADGTNVYLIADDYVHYTKTPQYSKYDQDTGKSEKVYLPHSAGPYMLDTAPWNEQDGIGEYQTSASDSLSYLLSKSKWNKLYKGDFADYAQGAATLMMYVNSYNQTHGTNIKVIEKIDNSYDAVFPYRCYVGKESSTEYSIPANEDYNGIYFKISKSKANGMHLATASCKNLGLGGMYSVGWSGSNSKIHGYVFSVHEGLRPIICLNSGVKFQKNSDGSYTLSY